MSSQPSLGAAAGTASFVTGRYRALAHDFCIETDDAALADYLGELFQPMAAPGNPRSRYRMATQAGSYGLWFDGEPLGEPGDSPDVLALLLWHINRQAIDRSGHFLRLHAAAAALGGAAVVLAAPMEAGKTTLVAGLVRAGLHYMTDEVTAVNPETGLIEAYPKALSVDPGSWEVLADLEPRPDPNLACLLPNQWQVTPTSIRPDAIARRARPRLVVFPRYVEAGTTVFEPVSRADALVDAIRATFAFHEAPQRDLHVLARLLRSSECYRLAVGDLDQACAGIIDRLQGSSKQVTGDSRT